LKERLRIGVSGGIRWKFYRRPEEDEVIGPFDHRVHLFEFEKGDCCIHDAALDACQGLFSLRLYLLTQGHIV